jgi:hypothetical protein
LGPAGVPPSARDNGERYEIQQTAMGVTDRASGFRGGDVLGDAIEKSGRKKGTRASQTHRHDLKMFLRIDAGPGISDKDRQFHKTEEA